MANAAVADAGPLIAFGRVGRIDLLTQMFREVLVPRTVAAECFADLTKPGAHAIREALDAHALIEAEDPAPDTPPFPVLDAGESSAIRLALKMSVPILIDEKTGRRIATNLGLRVIGSAGILLVAKQRGLIASVEPLLGAFEQNGYHFSAALLEAIRTRAGEK